MKEIIVVMAFIPPTVIFIVIISFTIYSIWYRSKKITKEHTSEYDKGWDKCWDCGKAEPTMYFSYNIFGRIYRCKKHSSL